MADEVLRCDMCHKPLRSARYKIEVLYRAGAFLTVGPDCFRKEKRAREEAQGRYAPDQIAAIRKKVAAVAKAEGAQ